MIKVHQNDISNLFNQINELGWNGAADKYPQVNTHFEVSFKGSQNYLPAMFQHYTHVANVDSDSLEEVFELTNCWEETHRIEKLARMHSLSVGDILETESGEFFMVDSCGFGRIEVEA